MDGTIRYTSPQPGHQIPPILPKRTEFTQLQAAILASTSKLLKPGGRLVYTTCSFLPQENRAIVDAFLAGHPYAVGILYPNPVHALK